MHNRQAKGIGQLESSDQNRRPRLKAGYNEPVRTVGHQIEIGRLAIVHADDALIPVRFQSDGPN
jgi:hypothetical protein